MARCEPCSLKHREGSGAFRGIPVWDPSWTVIEIATGREYGPYDSEADVALCLAFAGSTCAGSVSGPCLSQVLAS